MLKSVATGIAALCCACLLCGLSSPAAVAGDRALSSASDWSASAAHPRGSGAQLIKDVLKAWQITKGQGVTVAVIGGRVDPHAPGLSGKVRTGRGFGNYRHAAQFDSTVFASAVAGSGPSQQNPFGTIGLAPAARILSVRVSPRYRYGAWQGMTSSAIRYAVNHGAKVIFVAENSYSDAVSLDSAVAYAVSKNAVIVSDEFGLRKYLHNREYPNSLPGVVGAGTVILPGLLPPVRKRRPVTNDSVLVAAPGNALAVTGPRGAGYLIYNSYAAAAWVTATVALVKSVYHNLPPALVEQALVLSARDHPRHGYNTRVGYGLINPAGALREAAKLRRLRSAAPARPGVADPAARLAAGPAPGAINAVRHPLWKLAGFGGAALAGVFLLALAARQRRRRRRARFGPETPAPSGGPSGPGWPAAPGPGWPAAPSPGWPAAPSPGWPAAPGPDWPAAPSPGGQATRWPPPPET